MSEELSIGLDRIDPATVHGIMIYLIVLLVGRKKKERKTKQNKTKTKTKHALEDPG